MYHIQYTNGDQTVDHKPNATVQKILVNFLDWHDAKSLMSIKFYLQLTNQQLKEFIELLFPTINDIIENLLQP